MKLYQLSFIIAALLSVSIQAQGSVSAWFVPSTLKVVRDAKPPKNINNRWIIHSARNEVESCQVVLLSNKAVQGVSAAVSPLKHKKRKDKIPVELFKVEYVPNVVGNTPWPDPLPPLKSLNLQPNIAQPLWLLVRVPANAAPGTYGGKVEIKTDDETIILPLSLKVWDFALPETPSCATAFGVSSYYIYPQEGVSPDSQEARELDKKYYEFLLDHKISAFTIPVDLLSDEAVKYLEDPRMTSYMIPLYGDEEKQKQLIERLIKNGHFRKGYFYVYDEPVKKDQYEEAIKKCEFLKKIEPQVRITIPVYTNPDWDQNLRSSDLLQGLVNIWCPNSHYLDISNWLREYLKKRKNAGETYWWYVCCGPGAPYANFFVDMQGISHRILFWQQKMEGIDGLLYWSTTYWNPEQGCPDPWESMMTFRDINPKMRGDGSLLYPGKKVGVDGPVSSIRLEIIRDGIEDFEYLTLAEQRLGKEETFKYIRELVKNLQNYETDPEKVEEVRVKLGYALEKATAEARKKL